MGARITLKRNVQTTEKGTVRLRLTAVASEISPEIFAIEVLPAVEPEACPVLRFSHVCSVAELSEFPADTPHDSCYFRTADIEMIFDYAEQADRVYRCIADDIRKLIQEYNLLQTAPESCDTVEFV